MKWISRLISSLSKPSEPVIMQNLDSTLTLIHPLEENERKLKGRSAIYRCKCGTLKELLVYDVTKNRVKSCGCIVNPVGKANYAWQGHGEISGQFFNSIKYKAKQRGYDFDITIEHIWDLYVKQDGLCAYTGMPIGFDYLPSGKAAKRKICTASLDRIDSSIGYKIDNIQWVHKDIQRWKNNYSHEKFLEMVELVYLWKVRP